MTILKALSSPSKQVKSIVDCEFFVSHIVLLLTKIANYIDDFYLKKDYNISVPSNK